MRVVCLLLFICGTVSNASAQEPYSVTLRGQAESIEISNVSASSVSLTVKLKLELINNGISPVIFLETKPPLLVGAALSKSSVDLASGNNLVSEYAGESVDTSPEWIALRKSLNHPSPPFDKVRILMPNESWQLEDYVSIALPTESGKSSFFPKRETWERVQALSKLWLRTTYQTWSLNLEPLNYDRTKKTFGYSLQKRWKDFGLLWLDGIRSEPIILNLKELRPSLVKRSAKS